MLPKTHSQPMDLDGQLAGPFPNTTSGIRSFANIEKRAPPNGPTRPTNPANRNINNTASFTTATNNRNNNLTYSNKKENKEKVVISATINYIGGRSSKANEINELHMGNLWRVPWLSIREALALPPR